MINNRFNVVYHLLYSVIFFIYNIENKIKNMKKLKYVQLFEDFLIEHHLGLENYHQLKSNQIGSNIQKKVKKLGRNTKKVKLII